MYYSLEEMCYKFLADAKERKMLIRSWHVGISISDNIIQNGFLLNDSCIVMQHFEYEKVYNKIFINKSRAKYVKNNTRV